MTKLKALAFLFVLVIALTIGILSLVTPVLAGQSDQVYAGTIQEQDAIDNTQIYLGSSALDPGGGEASVVITITLVVLEYPLIKPIARVGDFTASVRIDQITQAGYFDEQSLTCQLNVDVPTPLLLRSCSQSNNTTKTMLHTESSGGTVAAPAELVCGVCKW